MFVQAVATILLVAYVLALDVSDIPPQYRALLPSDLKHFLANLSPEEEAALMDSFRGNSLPIEERLFVATIKKKSPRLGETIENVLANWRARIAALRPEAQEFANLIWNNGVKLVTQLAAGSKPRNDQLQMAVATILSRYNSLSSFAKADLRYQFPILSSALTDFIHKSSKHLQAFDIALGKQCDRVDNMRYTKGLTLLPLFNPNPSLRSFPIFTGFMG